MLTGCRGSHSSKWYHARNRTGCLESITSHHWIRKSRKGIEQENRHIIRYRSCSDVHMEPLINLDVHVRAMSPCDFIYVSASASIIASPVMLTTNASTIQRILLLPSPCQNARALTAQLRPTARRWRWSGVTSTLCLYLPGRRRPRCDI